MIENLQRRSLFIYLCLTVLIIAVYYPVRHFGFIGFDDPTYVSENPHLRSGFTLNGCLWAFTTTYAANWHPLTWLSHILDYQWFGLAGGGHHVMNVAFHIANTLLLFTVLRQMTAAHWRSGFVAALFALHPLHVESVAWVAERKDVLSAFFWMLTIWAYVRYCAQPNRTRYLLALGLYAMGLMAKPMVVTLPFVLLLLDYWPLGRIRSTKSATGEIRQSSFRKLVKEKLPFFALTAGSCVVTYLAQHRAGTVLSFVRLPLSIRTANALAAYVGYIGKAIWPRDLAVFYPLPTNLWASAVIAAGVALAGITAVVISAARSRPWLATGWFWYLGTLVPVIGLVQVGNQAMADRYTYIPLIGLFIMLSWTLPGNLFERRVSRLVASVAVGSVIVMCVVRSRIQVSYWKDTETLFSHALDVTRDNWLAHYNLGVSLQQAGRMQEAIAHWEQAVQLRPNYAEAQNNLGKALLQDGKRAEAIKHLRQAVQVNPTFFEALANLGDALMKSGEPQEALVYLERAARIKPDSAFAQHELGNALLQVGKVREAIPHYDEALRIAPDYIAAQNDLAWVLATCSRSEGGEPARAVALAQRACDSTGFRAAPVLDTLAAAYAADGRFKEAITTAEKAIETAAAAGQLQLESQIKIHLRSYRAGHMWQEPAAVLGQP